MISNQALDVDDLKLSIPLALDANDPLVGPDPMLHSFLCTVSR